MGDPLGIDSTLRSVENWVYQGHDLPADHSHWYVPITHWGPFPPLSEMVADARHIYDFAVMHIPDSDLLREMAGTLAAIRDEAEKHASELNSSLDALGASWQGPAAEAYYAPPGFHADQITPGGTAYTLMRNLHTVTQGSATNHQSHIKMAGSFSDMQGHQTNLYESLGGAVIAMGATVAVAGADFEVTGPGMAADIAWGVRVAQTISDLIPTIEIAVDVETIATAAGIVLVTMTLMSLSGDSGSTLSEGDVQTLAELYGVSVGLIRALAAAGLTESQIEALLEAGFTEDQLSQLVAAGLSADQLMLAYTLKTSYGLAFQDILTIVRNGLTLAAVAKYLSRPCFDLPGIGQVLVDALVKGDQGASQLLSDLENEAAQATSSNVGNATGAQRVFGVLKQLGLNVVRRVGFKIPGSDADIVLQDGATVNGVPVKAIEVTGPGKFLDENGNFDLTKFTNQINAYKAQYGDDVALYLENDGSDPRLYQQMLDAAKGLLGENRVVETTPEWRQPCA